MAFGTWPRTTPSGLVLAIALLKFSLFVFQTSSQNSEYVQNGGVSSDSGNFYDATAAPVNALPQRSNGDAPWTQSEDSYRKMIFCPRGSQNKAMPKGIVLLVPGTGGNASEAYESSAYYHDLPSQGFAVCWVNIPNYSLDDMQLAAEFVAYAVKYLAPKSTSTGGKINIVSYSQGGPNVQWASTFWPSIQKLVKGHVALAPSMKGSAPHIYICPFLNLVGGCQPSVWQQSAGSSYMRAANSHHDQKSAAYAQIPTTIIYTLVDEVVIPQVGPEASSRLIGSTNIAIQSICGILRNPEHFTIVADVGVYGIALDALKNGRPAKESTIDRSYCTKTAESLGYSVGNIGNYLRFAFRTAVGDPEGMALAPPFNKLLVTKEPLLQQYVCDRGYATSGCTRNGFRKNST